MSHTPAAPDMDLLDRRLLEAMQGGIPLEPRPYAALGAALGIGEDEVLARLARLKAGRVVRQVSAIFDSRALGYASSLVAARVAPDRLEEAAAAISAHPGVSHNYEREHAFNLWYTVTVPPDSTLGLERTVQRLHELSGAGSTRMLPTLRLFKIGVKIGLGAGDEGESAGYTEADAAIAGRHRITPADHPCILALQRDLPVEPAPFERLAAGAGLSGDALLDAARRFRARRQMRRFAAVLHHRAAGAMANAMGVWPVPADRIGELGPRLAAFPEVSHCYHRPSHPDWPYSVFTMVHAADRAAALDLLARMGEATGVAGWSALFSTREFKKVRVRYFTPDNAAWEAAHGGGGTEGHAPHGTLEKAAGMPAA